MTHLGCDRILDLDLDLDLEHGAARRPTSHSGMFESADMQSGDVITLGYVELTFLAPEAFYSLVTYLVGR